ncbi:pirin family protein [Aeromonas rivipollensis]|nr:pirin family protein [Aeromonas rivipollensis]
MHRCFETVAIFYQGEVVYGDSYGNVRGGGVIGPGDVQWITSNLGIHD